MSAPLKRRFRAVDRTGTVREKDQFKIDIFCTFCSCAEDKAEHHGKEQTA
jgi:hypothetical protein